MFKKKRNDTVFWLIFIPMAIVLLSYIFVILNFFSFSPNNITAKMAVWPFFSTSAKGEMYLQATVDISYTVDQKDLDLDDESSYRDAFRCNGVVISEDGFVLAPFQKYLDKSKEIHIYTYSGQVFSGKLMFCDKNFYLAIIKCESSDEENKNSAIKMPYVKISKQIFGSVNAIATEVQSTYSYNDDVVEMARSWEVPWKASVFQSRFDCFYDYRTVDGSYLGLNIALENFYEFKAENAIMHVFLEGPVFNDYGYLVGIAVQQFEMSESSSRLIVPAFLVQSVIQNVKDAYYQNRSFQSLAQSVSGLSKKELDCHLKISDTATDNNIGGMDEGFYFQNDWLRYDASENIMDFHNSAESGFLLLKDFCGKNPNGADETIEKFSIIEKVCIGKNTYQISEHSQLLQILYGAAPGTNVSIYYKQSVGQQNLDVATFVA